MEWGKFWLSQQATGGIGGTGGDVDLNNIDSLRFTSTGDTSVPQLLAWNSTKGTLNLGMAGGAVIQQIGLEQFYRVYNGSGSPIILGSVVMSSGTNDTQFTIANALADGSNSHRKILGIATETIANTALGYVTSFGVVSGFDTNGQNGETWVNGDILYVSPSISGGLTNVKPHTPNQAIQVATVLNANINGSLFVRLDQGDSVYDLHDVKINSLTDGDILLWDNTTQSWINSAAGGLTGDALVIIAETPPVSATEGALWWNNTNARLAIRYSSTWVSVTAASIISYNIINSELDTTSNFLYPVMVDTLNSNTALAKSSSNFYFDAANGTLSATTFNTLSDQALKDNIIEIIEPFNVLNAIRPVQFNWKETDLTSYGVIAQELEQILPDMVFTGPDGLKSVNYDGLIAWLIAAVKELNIRIQ